MKTIRKGGASSHFSTKIGDFIGIEMSDNKPSFLNQTIHVPKSTKNFVLFIKKNKFIALNLAYIGLA